MLLPGILAQAAGVVSPLNIECPQRVSHFDPEMIYGGDQPGSNSSVLSGVVVAS